MLPELVPNAKLREEIITLDELVESIEEIIEKTRKPGVKEKLASKRVEFNLNLSEETLDTKIEKILVKIKTRMDSERLVTFSALLDKINSVEIVNTFIPLLFLMNNGKVLMWQESFFDEILISLLDEPKTEEVTDFEVMKPENLKKMLNK